MPHPLPTQYKTWDFHEVKNWKVLSGERLKEFVMKMFNLLHGDFMFLTNRSEVLFFKLPGDKQMWTVTDSDVAWFMKSIFTTGKLELEVRGPKGPNSDWKRFSTDYGHWTAILQRDLALDQSKARQKGLFVKAKHTRQKHPNWLRERVPHA